MRRREFIKRVVAVVGAAPLVLPSNRDPIPAPVASVALGVDRAKERYRVTLLSPLPPIRWRPLNEHMHDAMNYPVREWEAA